MRSRTVCALILAVTIQSPYAGSQEAGFPVLTGPYLGQDPPGDTPVLFAPDLISTGKEHSAAMFTPDGQEIWFGRLFPARIYSMSVGDGRWRAPQVAPVCDTFNDLYPVLSPDGNAVFFTSDRPGQSGGDRLPRGEGLIWVMERAPTGWSDARCLDSTVNIGTLQSCGSISATGTLYFTAKQDGEAMDIYCSQPRNGSYTVPRRLTEIGSVSPQHSPFVAPDESYLIFSSFRGGYGRSDLFISFRCPDGTWSEPRNMGPEINSAYKDEYPYVTPDGKYLFFNSNRPSVLNARPIPDGPGNIYWVSAAVIQELREQRRRADSLDTSQ